jgi:hypothetical protein
MEPNSTANVPPSSYATLMQMLTGKWVSKAISTAAELNLADHLAEGPLSIPQLAGRCQAHERSLLRLMRALASVGVFFELDDQRFRNSPLSECLRTSSPASMRSTAMFLGDHPMWDAWRDLTTAVRTGSCPFETIHGAQIFEYMAKNPGWGKYFDDTMSGLSVQETEAVQRAFDFGVMGTIADLGGGHGALLCSILQKNPKQSGVLFDQPHVLEGAKATIASMELGARVKLTGGNFFEEVPVTADCYMLKHIIHDWDDERCTTILKNVKRAMRPGSRLLVIDMIIRPDNQPGFVKFLDLDMMLMYAGGYERTEAEFRKLFEAAGLKLQRVIDTESTSSIFEATT